MERIQYPVKADSCVLVLGMFDGVHRGHQALLMAGEEEARGRKVPLVVSTFEPHPLEVLMPQRAPRRLTTPDERAGLLEQWGVDTLCEIPFTAETAATPPKRFLEHVWESYHPSCVICGFNYTFGARGEGRPEDIVRFGAEKGFDALVVPPVRVAGDTVSSTRIRAELEKGDIRMVSRLLGHAYTFEGTVEQGKHIGRTLGFPTADVSYTHDKAFPRYGVYIGYLKAEGARSEPSVINIGRHPTLPEGGVTIECHVLGGHPSLYDRRVKVTLMDFLREEKRFGCVEELAEQLKADREKAEAWFAQHA